MNDIFQMSEAKQRGVFIVFEGCDRSGKTTQVIKLVERLNKSGQAAVMRRFPTEPRASAP